MKSKTLSTIRQAKASIMLLFASLLAVNSFAWDINDIVISGDEVYVATEAGLFLIDNKGQSCKRINNGLAIIEIMFLDVNGSSILVADHDCVYFSDDKGENWANLTGTWSDLVGTNKIIWGITLTESSIILKISDSNYISDDIGKTWNEIKGLTKYANINRIPETNLLFSNCSNGIKWSDNNCKSWITLSKGIPKHAYISSAILRGDSLFAAINGDNEKGVYVAALSDLNWIQTGFNFQALSIAVNETTMLARPFGGGNGVCISNDRGKNWHVAKGTESKKVSDLLYCGATFYAILDNELYKSSDNGNTWELINRFVFASKAEMNKAYPGRKEKYKRYAEMSMEESMGIDKNKDQEELSETCNEIYEYLSQAILYEDDPEELIKLIIKKIQFFTFDMNYMSWNRECRHLLDLSANEIYSTVIYDFESALQIAETNKQFENIFYNRGLFLFNKGDYLNAEQDYLKALQYWETDGINDVDAKRAYWYTLSEIYSKLFDLVQNTDAVDNELATKYNSQLSNARYELNKAQAILDIKGEETRKAYYKKLEQEHHDYLLKNNLWMSCGQCYGLGVKPTETTCPDCKGDGHYNINYWEIVTLPFGSLVPIGAYWWEDGAGVHYYRLLACPSCLGTGKITRKCDACDGTGRVR